MDSGSDPRIPGEANRKHVLSTSGSKTTVYRSFVTKSKQRKAVGQVVHDVAWSNHGVVIHCKQGKDRTGWVSGPPG